MKILQPRALPWFVLGTLLLFGACTTGPGWNRVYDHPDGIRVLAKELAENLPPQVDGLALGGFFLSDGRKSQFTENLYGQFRDLFAVEAPSQVLLEREQVERALSETAYTLPGVIQNPLEIAEIGRFVPADALIAGSVSVLEDTLLISVRIFDVRDGEVLAAASVEEWRTNFLDQQLPMVF